MELIYSNINKSLLLCEEEEGLQGKSTVTKALPLQSCVQHHVFVPLLWESLSLLTGMCEKLYHSHPSPRPGWAMSP